MSVRLNAVRLRCELDRSSKKNNNEARVIKIVLHVCELMWVRELDQGRSKKIFVWELGSMCEEVMKSRMSMRSMTKSIDHENIFGPEKINEPNRRSRLRGVAEDQFCVMRVFDHVRQLRSHRMDAGTKFCELLPPKVCALQSIMWGACGRPGGHGSCWNPVGWEEGSGEVLRVTRAWATLCSRSNLIRRAFKISDELNRSFAKFSEPRLLPGGLRDRVFWPLFGTC